MTLGRINYNSFALRVPRTTTILIPNPAFGNVGRERGEAGAPRIELCLGDADLDEGMLAQVLSPDVGEVLEQW